MDTGKGKTIFENIKKEKGAVKMKVKERRGTNFIAYDTTVEFEEEGNSVEVSIKMFHNGFSDEKITRIKELQAEFARRAEEILK